MTLFHYELKKIFMRRIVWITLAFTLVMCTFPVVLPLCGSYVVNGEKVDTNYHKMQTDRGHMEQLKGRMIDTALLKETVRGYAMIPEDASPYVASEEYQEYARPYSAIYYFIQENTGMGLEEIRRWDGGEEALRAMRAAKLESSYQEIFLTEGEKDFWRQKEEELEWPVRFEIAEGYYPLMNAVSTLCFFIPLCLAVCLADVFAGEHTRRTDQMILSGRKGRDAVYRAKMAAGISFAAVCTLVISTVLVFINFTFGVYGTEGFQGAFQLMYAGYSLSLTVGEAILIMYGVLLTAAALFAVLILFLSEALRSSLAALAVTAVYLILALMVRIPGHLRVLGQIWDWLPGAFVTPWEIFDLRLFPFFGKYLVAWQAVPILYLLAAAGLALAGAHVYRRYQVAGR